MSVLRLVAVAVVACAPHVDGPVERAAITDRIDGDRLGAELAALPGVVSAHATLHHAIRDPLAGSSSIASARVVIVVDPAVDRGATSAMIDRFVHAAFPQIPSPELVIEAGHARAELATVGPFTVAAVSKRPLAMALAAGLAVIVALAGALAWTVRPGARA